MHWRGERLTERERTVLIWRDVAGPKICCELVVQIQTEIHILVRVVISQLLDVSVHVIRIVL